MPKKHVFKRVECPKCGIEIIVFDKTRTKSNPWIDTPEQLRQCDAERIALHFYGTLQEIEALLYDGSQTDRESRILAIIVAALNLTDREIAQQEKKDAK